MSRASSTQRLRAARALRSGKSFSQAAREAGVSKRTISRWMREEGFLELLHGVGVITLGQVQVRTSADAVLEEGPSEESWLWIDAARGEVLGSLLVAEATHLRAAFISTRERVDEVRRALAEQRFPARRGEPTIVLSQAALQQLQDNPADRELLIRIATAPPAESFRAFLSVWRFRAQETKDIRTLGSELWDAQETFVREITSNPHVYALKARKLGQTTIACAYDAYVLRFRDENARVHLFSRREKAALELLEAVRFGLDRLPEFLRLPYSRRTAHEFELAAGVHDRRLAVTYPTSDDTAVEATGTHSHIDEWADMPNPDKVYQGLEPTFSAPGCTSLIITTGAGPANPSADYWRNCLAGDGLHHPVFIPATARPDRDDAWLEHKRKTMLPDAFSTEYALTWEAAIAGTGGRVFSCGEIDEAMTDAMPLSTGAAADRKYVIAWDIGSLHDHSVGIVLDVTEELIDVVSYVRVKGGYPTIQKAILDLHHAFARASFTVIEANSSGQAVADNVNIPEHQLRRFTTTKDSKARIIENLRLRLQDQTVKFHPSLRQLESELREYQLPDQHCVNDSVIALAIGLDHAAEAQGFQARGRLSRSLSRSLNAPPSTRKPISTGIITWTPAN